MPRAWARCIPPSLIPRWDRSLTAPFARSHRRTSPDLLLRCITSTSGLMGTSPLRNFFYCRFLPMLAAQSALCSELFRPLALQKSCSAVQDYLRQVDRLDSGKCCWCIPRFWAKSRARKRRTSARRNNQVCPPCSLPPDLNENYRC